MNPLNKLLKSRRNVIASHLYWGALSIRLELKEDPGCKTAWTDGIYIGYEPKFILESPETTCDFLIAHEVMHVKFDHINIPEGYDFEVWNYSCDHVVNLIANDVGFVVPYGALMDKRFAGMSAHQVYDILMKEKQGKQNQQQQGQQSQQQQGQQSQQRQQQGTGQGKDSKKNEQIGQVKRPTNKDGSIMSESEKNELKRSWQQSMVQAQTIARKAGEMSRDMEKILSEILSPRPDASEYIRKFVDELSQTDISWKRLNKRYLCQDLFLPTAYSKDLGHIVVAIDTSGSLYMDQDALKLIAGNLDLIMDSYEGVSMTVLYCDYSIRGTQELSREDMPISLEAKGGGGTKFNPVFEYLEEENIVPTCLLYFTDGRVKNYPDSPFYPVLWVGSEDFEPPFGDFVRM